MKSKKAFTLIELLVVIAIIALLLSVIMPALRKAKEHAKMLICKSNQRSIVQAVAAYGPSNDGKLPLSITSRGTGTGTIPLRLKYYYGDPVREINGGSVTETLGGYMESPEYFDCPMAGHDPDWQSRFLANAQNQQVPFLNSSYFMLWNWKRFEKTRPSFKPTDAGGDGLMTCDVIFYNEPYNNQHGGTQWVSSHPWAGAEKRTFLDAMSGGTLNQDFTFWMMDDGGVGKPPKMKLNAGYKDCHVETINTDGFERMDAYYWLPRKRR